MILYPTLMLAVLCQICMKGSRILISLYALELGANAFVIGTLISLYGAASLFLAIYAGRTSDRLGVRLPMAAGAVGVSCGLLLPYIFRNIPALYFSAPLIGGSYIFFQVSMQNLMGSIGSAEDRPRNYSMLSLGAAVSSFLGPISTGFSIDRFGHGTTYGLLAGLAVTVGACLLFWPFLPPPRKTASKKKGKQTTADIFKHPDMRRILTVSSMIITGLYLFDFYIPIYGKSIGFSASLIGLVMGCYAVAAFVVRILMSAMVKRFSADNVLTACLLVSGTAFVFFPIFQVSAVLAGLAFLLGLGLGCGQPLSIMLTYNRSPEGRSGEALGVRLTTNKSIQVAVPLIFGSIGSVLGLFPVFWTGAAMLLGGGILNGAISRKKTSASSADKAS